MVNVINVASMLSSAFSIFIPTMKGLLLLSFDSNLITSRKCRGEYHVQVLIDRSTELLVTRLRQTITNLSDENGKQNGVLEEARAEVRELKEFMKSVSNCFTLKTSLVKRSF